MYTMELPSQSGLVSPGLDPCTDSDSDQTPSRAQTRKSNKPLLEKKRRARINKSLEQLKGLVLEASKKDSARYSKLEKADILEMTVKHLREVQQHQMSVAMSVDPTVVGKFRTGFGECAQEVDRYLSTIDGLSSEVRVRLMQHLSSCANAAQNLSPGAPHPYANVGLYPAGIPSGSPPHVLPGMAMRSGCGLPFGGLAVSPQESLPVPVSRAAVSSPGRAVFGGTHGYRVSSSEGQVSVAESAGSKRAANPCSLASASYKPEPAALVSKKDNSENIAPHKNIRPLAEKHNNSNGPTSTRIDGQSSTANNMNNCSSHIINSSNNKFHEAPSSNSCELGPPTKRARLDTPRCFPGAENRGERLNALEMNLKMEPVWRPW